MAVLIIFPVILQAVINLTMLSIVGQGVSERERTVRRKLDVQQNASFVPCQSQYRDADRSNTKSNGKAA